MNKQQKELYSAVDEILWKKWNPIGADDIPRDEYISYVPEIFSMLIYNKTENEIAERLYKIETEIIGVVGDREHCLRVARELIKEKERIIL